MQRTLFKDVERGFKSLENIDTEMAENIQNSLNIYEKIVLRFTGHLFIASFEKKGWKGKLPFYLFKCEKHGYQIGYPHGFEACLICEECRKNNVRVHPTQPRKKRQTQPGSDISRVRQT